MLQYVESDGLGKRTALADGDDVTLLHVDEAGGEVDGEIAVPLLESSVLSNILQVIASANDGSLHLVGDDHALKDTAADGHVAGEGALLVDVLA